MADNEVVLSIRTELSKILDELDKISSKNKEVSESFKSHAKGVDEAITGQTKDVNTMFDKMRSTSRRVFDQMKQDFKTLASIESLKAGLKLSNQFEGSLKQVFDLSDAVRRLGGSFGVARSDFAKFQGALSRGFGDIGASSEEAANVLQGLAGSGVVGEKGVVEYGTTAAQLGMLSGERGQAGNIAGSMASVVRAQGKDVNDIDAMRSLAREVTAVSKTTGAGASEILRQMQDVFEAMPAELRKSMSAKGIAQIGIASQIAGPQAAEALKSFLGKSAEERAGMEAQGLGGMFTKEGGIDLKAFKKFNEEAKKMGVSARLFAKTKGLEGDAAEGLVRLMEKSDQLGDALEQTAGASRDYAKESRRSMGFGEAFRANIRKVQGIFGEELGGITQEATNILSGASESGAGAAAVSLGGGALAAILAGGGLKGIGSGLGIGGLMKASASEAITGRAVQDVRVINTEEFKEGGGLGGLGGKIFDKIPGGVKGLAMAAAPVAIAAGATYAGAKIAENISWENSKGFEGNAFEQLFFRMDQLFNTDRYKQMQAAQKIMVEVDVRTKTKELEAAGKATRGATQ